MSVRCYDGSTTPLPASNMSVSTKGLVVTRCKDALFIADLVERSIRAHLRQHDAQAVAAGAAKGRLELNQPSTRLSSVGDALIMEFELAGARRSLFVMLHCDSDNLAIAPGTVSLSIGAWGESERLMKAVLEGLSALGPVWFDANDSDSTPLERLAIPPLDYREACERGLTARGMLRARRWQQMFEAGCLHSTVHERALGFTPEEMARVLAGDPPEHEAAPEAAPVTAPGRRALAKP